MYIKGTAFIGIDSSNKRWVNSSCFKQHRFKDYPGMRGVSNFYGFGILANIAVEDQHIKRMQFDGHEFHESLAGSTIYGRGNYGKLFTLIVDVESNQLILKCKDFISSKMQTFVVNDIKLKGFKYNLAIAMDTNGSCVKITDFCKKYR